MMRRYYAVTAIAAVLSFGFAFGAYTQAFAETTFRPNVRVDDSGSTATQQRDPSIAVDRNGNIYAVWADDRNGEPSTWDIRLARSTDGGASFGPSVRVNGDNPIPLFSSITPPLAVAVDPAGKIYVAWQGYDSAIGCDSIYVSRSADGGASFGPAVRVDESGGIVFSSNLSPQITADLNGNIYVVWNDARDGNSDIYFSKSVDEGISFSANVRVNDDASVPARQWKPAIAVDAAGNIYVSWTDNRNGVDARDVYFARSTDGGASFGTNARVNDTGLVTQPYERSSIVVDTNQNIYVAWASYDNNYYIYFARSADGGSTFSPHIRVDDSIWTSGSGHPSITVDASDNIHVVWKDGRNYYDDIYFAKSTDGGSTFSTNARVNDTGPDGCNQFNPSVAVNSNGDIDVVWEDYRNDYIYKDKPDIYFARGIPGVPAAPIITADLDASGKDEVVIDFGMLYGIWMWCNNEAWTNLHSMNPDFMVKGNIDGDQNGRDDLVINFGLPYGIWIYYNNSTWQQLHNLSADSIVTADLDNNGKDDVVINFGPQYGIWIHHDDNSWTQLHNLSPKSMAVGNIDSDPRKDLILDFGPQHGIWVYANNSTWYQLHNLSADSIVTADLDNNGKDDVVINFGPQYGIWIRHDDNSWTQLHNLSPKSMAVGNIDSNPRKDLILDFGSQHGIWVYANNSTWTQIHNLSADSIATGDMNANGKDELIIDFGFLYGIWVRDDDGTWRQLHNLSP